MPPSLTYNDMLGAYAPYPAPIRPFLLRAETHPAIRSQLTKSFMRVFIDILGRAPIAHPLRPLKLRIDVIAENLNISTRTVDRAIGFLKKQGWLNQDSQNDGRNHRGKFSPKDFLLGTELRHLLGLPTELPSSLPHEQEKQPVDNPAPNAENALNQVDNSATETKMSHGLYTGVNNVFKKEASFKEDASQLKNQKTNPKNKPVTGQTPANPLQTALPKQPKLPGDLVEMATTLNIHPLGICSLMQLAKQANQRLQDIWRVKRDQLINAGVREGRAFRYIQFLLDTGEDFAFRARQHSLSQPSPSQAITPPAKREMEDVRHYRNKKYVGANGLRVRIHGDGSAEIQSATKNPSYVCPGDMPSVYEAVRNGKLWLVEE